ncbi:oxidoreductase-like protein [Tricladium varicosporioides]|nr:oxidoreductase-like protein [Hymenoscyphus varicosporioides]
MEARLLARASQRLQFRPAMRHQQTRHNSNKPFTQQANPIGDYYTSILESSSPIVTAKPPTTASYSSTLPTSLKEDASAATPEPSILFSSRLSSPLERRSEIRKKSVLVAGIWVPPKPEEPDNCCMSGCVNCVWDRYGDELEEWAVARKVADQALKKEETLEKDKKRIPGNSTQQTMTNMDNDGGGGDSNWGTGLETDFTSEDLFKGVPVGIREFMKQEKRLKEKHAREGTQAG